MHQSAGKQRTHQPAEHLNSTPHPSWTIATRRHTRTERPPPTTSLCASRRPGTVSESGHTWCHTHCGTHTTLSHPARTVPTRRCCRDQEAWSQVAEKRPRSNAPEAFLPGSAELPDLRTNLSQLRVGQASAFKICAGLRSKVIPAIWATLIGHRPRAGRTSNTPCGQTFVISDMT